jgi:hypothetical protein
VTGMQERAAMAGGQLAVWSELGSGTKIEVTIPASNAYTKSASAGQSMSSGQGTWPLRTRAIPAVRAPGCASAPAGGIEALNSRAESCVRHARTAPSSIAGRLETGGSRRSLGLSVIAARRRSAGHRNRKATRSDVDWRSPAATTVGANPGCFPRA